MGGYDIFMCKSDGNGGWGEPQNLGYRLTHLMMINILFYLQMEKELL